MEKYTKKFENKSEQSFLIITSFLSALTGFLYIWKGFLEQFYTGTFIIIFSAFIFIPIVWIFRRNGFIYYNLIYAAILVFIIAFHDTYLYNNYTALLAILIVVMLNPKLKWIALGIYVAASSVAFAINEENLCHFFIHLVRGTWLFHIFFHILTKKYETKKLILFDDEIKILTELSKNRLQKSIELEGFSESTIYRRIKAAMKRNNLSKNELLEEFKKELAENEHN